MYTYTSRRPRRPLFGRRPRAVWPSRPPPPPAGQQSAALPPPPAGAGVWSATASSTTLLLLPLNNTRSMQKVAVILVLNIKKTKISRLTAAATLRIHCTVHVVPQATK